MSTPPVGISGILRVDTKQTDLTAGQYNGNARPGELVVDLTTYDMFIGNLEGFLNPFQNPESFKTSFLSNGTSNVKIHTANGNITFSANGTANVASIGLNATTIAGNLIPSANSTYSLGNVTNQWKNVWISGHSLYMNGVVVESIGGVLSLNGQPIITAAGAIVNTTVLNSSNSITAAGNLTVANDMIVSGVLSSSGTIATNSQLTAAGDIITTNFSSGNTINAVNNITASNVNLAGNVAAVDMFAADGMTATGQVVTNGNVYGDRITSKTGPITLISIAPNQNIILDPTGSLDLSGANLGNVLNPVQPQDVATKSYVDGVGIVGYQPKDTVQVATTASLATLTGGTVIYNNGTAGVGATLTLSAGIVTLDGIPLVVGDRILVKDETDQTTNGIYDYTSTDTLTRSTDSDVVADLAVGSYYYVRTGATFAKQGFIIRTTVTTIGTSPIVFLQVTGQSTVSAGTDLTLSANRLAIANSGVVAGTYGNTARGVQITVTGTGFTTAIANTMVEGPVTDWVVTNRLTAGNISTLSGVTGSGNITTTGNISGSYLSTTRNVTLGTNTSVSGKLDLNGTATISALSARSITTTMPAGIYNARRLNVTNIYSQEFDAEFSGSATFNSITSMGLVGNLTIPGGTAGAMLKASGDISGAYWDFTNDVTITSPITNFPGDTAVGGTIKARYALGGSSTLSFGPVTTPTGWMVGKDNSGLATIGNARVSGAASGQFPIELCSGSIKRGGVYAKPGWSQSDFLRRDYPLLVEAQYSGTVGAQLSAPDWNGMGTGGMWLAMGACQDEIAPANNLNNFWYPLFSFNPNIVSEFHASAIAVTATQPIDGFINSPNACPVQLYNYQGNGRLAWPPIVTFSGSQVLGGGVDIAGQVPTPIGGQLQISKARLMGDTMVKLGMLYVWPSNSTRRYLHYFFNDTLLYTHTWVPDGKDWIDLWGRDLPGSPVKSNQIPTYILAGAGSAATVATIQLYSLTFQSGQALYYNMMNSLSSMNMPT